MAVTQPGVLGRIVRTFAEVGLVAVAALCMIGMLKSLATAKDYIGQPQVAEGHRQIALYYGIGFGLAIVSLFAWMVRQFYIRRALARKANKTADLPNAWEEAGRRAKPASIEEMHDIEDDGDGDQGTYKDGEYQPYDPSDEWHKH